MKRSSILSLIPIFIFVVLSTISIIKLASGHASPSLTAEITYDSSLTDTEIDFLKNQLANNSLRHSITFRADTILSSELQASQLIYDVYVPATSPQNPVSDLTFEQFNSLTLPTITTVNSTILEDDIKLIRLSELTPEIKLLSVDNNYYLDTISGSASGPSGPSAKLRVITIESSDPADLDTLQHTLSAPSVIADYTNTFSFAQTGVNAISRAMLLRTSNFADNGAYFAANIKDFLSKNDLTHISSEVSYHHGCQGDRGTMTLCSDWRTLDSITALGTDIVELTGNHNNNYGASDNIATIEKYHELGISTVGGGINEKEAKKPLRLTSQPDSTDSDYTTRSNAKNLNLTFIAVNESTSTVENGELAHGDQPGANGYDAQLVTSQIKAAKARGDFVLVDVQFAECYCYPDEGEESPECDAPISGQKQFFRNLIDEGADMVVGTQAHQPQTFELYSSKPIFYGLGNLMFDQTYWPGTRRSLILTHYFANGRYVQTRISPTIYDETFQVELMDQIAAETYLNRLIKASAKL